MLKAAWMQMQQLHIFSGSKPNAALFNQDMLLKGRTSPPIAAGLLEVSLSPKEFHALVKERK